MKALDKLSKEMIVLACTKEMLPVGASTVHLKMIAEQHQNQWERISEHWGIEKLNLPSWLLPELPYVDIEENLNASTLLKKRQYYDFCNNTRL